MEKKYELTNECVKHYGRTLYRIRAIRSFGDVTKGDLGGYIEAERNLSHDDNAWVCDNARVYDNARVFSNAEVYGSARVNHNSGYAVISGFGTKYRTTTFFKCADGLVRVKCGCFYGTIDEFREQVRNTREGNVAEEYLMIADLMEKHFGKEENDEIQTTG